MTIAKFTFIWRLRIIRFAALSTPKKNGATIMRRMSICLLLMIPCLLLGAVVAIPLSADEKQQTNYHVIFFACEREGNPPRYSHTWATFVKSTQDGALEAGIPNLDESITLSWMPESGIIPALFTVRGRNYYLDEAFAWPWQDNTLVVVWCQSRLARN